MNITFQTFLDIAKDLVVILGFPLTILGAYLAIQQFQRSITWNKLNATFSLFGNKQYTEAQAATATELSRIGISFYSLLVPLEKAQVDLIIGDNAAYGAVKSLLNYFEDYSTALHVGVLHRDTAFHLMGDVITRYFRVFEPLIKRRREVSNQTALWAEFEMASIVFQKLWVNYTIKRSDAAIKALQIATAEEYYKPPR